MKREVIEFIAAIGQKPPAGNVRVGLLAGLLLVGTALGACTKEGPEKAQATPAAVGADAGFPEVLATIGDERITMADIRARAGDQLERIDTQARLVKSSIIEAALDSMLDERVVGAEAKKQGKTFDELVMAEAGVGVNPSDADIAAWYQANKDRTGGRPLEQISAQIADVLRSENKASAAARLRERLNNERKVAVNFQPYRLEFDNGSAPTLGGKENAPVTLVEFSDFQCPFCNRFAPTLKQVEQKYGDKVQIVYRQYPIPSIHPFAFKASEASLCAHEQGKFWQLHDLMFAEQKKLAVADLKEKAVRLGMDKKKFDTCLDTGRYVEQVQKDVQDASRVGVTGTPAVFINGVQLKGGAVAFSVVAAAIDKELARTKAN